MMEIIVNGDTIFNQHHFDKANERWANAKDCAIAVALAREDYEEVVEKLLQEIPKELSYAILSELLDRDDFPSHLLEKVYEKGDKGCRVAICLRTDLPFEVALLCESSDDIDIKEHYLHRKTK